MYTQRPTMTPFRHSLILIAVSVFCTIACDQTDQGGGDAQPRAPLPPNTSDDTPLSSLSQESGMSGAEVCQLMTSSLVDLFSADSVANFVCGSSAMAASFNVPEGGGEVCDIVYNECRENYTVTAECDERVIAEIDRCSLPAGLWRSCIDEQYALMTAAGQLNFSCGDLPGYASGLEAIGKRYSTSACEGMGFQRQIN